MLLFPFESTRYACQYYFGVGNMARWRLFAHRGASERGNSLKRKGVIPPLMTPSPQGPRVTTRAHAARPSRPRNVPAWFLPMCVCTLGIGCPPPARRKGFSMPGQEPPQRCHQLTPQLAVHPFTEREHAGMLNAADPATQETRTPALPPPVA